MRNIYGSKHLSDSTAAVQFGTTVASEKVLWANMKARAGNGGSMYIGSSTAVNSTNGYELKAGDALDEDYRGSGPTLASVSGARFWVTSSSTTDSLDFAMGLED